MKLSALLLTSVFALLVVSTPLALAPECLALEASGLIETITGTLCGTRCKGVEGECDSTCPYCSCGYCKSTQPPKRRSDLADAPVLKQRELMLSCGSPCTDNTQCGGCTNWCQTSSTGGHCHPHLKERAELEDAAPMEKKATEVCFGKCGSDEDCPACSPWCWPTRVGGSCRDAPYNPPKLMTKSDEEITKDNIPALFEKDN